MVHYYCECFCSRLSESHTDLCLIQSHESVVDLIMDQLLMWVTIMFVCFDYFMSVHLSRANTNFNCADFLGFSFLPFFFSPTLLAYHYSASALPLARLILVGVFLLILYVIFSPW